MTTIDPTPRVTRTDPARELEHIETLSPATGLLDLHGQTGVLRTSGYLSGPDDIHVPARLIRNHDLRRGDLLTGLAQPNAKGGKHAPLVRVDTVNGHPVAELPKRPRFQDLTTIHPDERLRLETTPNQLTTRVTDLIMPIGKGQRALVVAPPKAGKTSVLRAIAHGIAANHPETHLMLVLVGERPEEVTDLSRGVPAEVVAATFDHSPAEQTALAELAIERAQRLAEEGRDVVVLLDSLTRLARAYNMTGHASGRILSGGLDSSALLPPKRFLGAARNLEGGGSLTIIATALVETGSLADTVIFEEYKGTGNAELKLDRELASRHVFPAVDIAKSSTRRDELLFDPAERLAVDRLRRTLAGLDDQRALDLLLDGLRKTGSNAEFLANIIRK
ncbi:transcription termination factor Rho [Nocardia yunnanensis]|uniref:Transcription termination factor Rho n=1 Tax=Nocardia yunnanensis TaxID=2382165 RepID=A0A386ZG56_9NOCA|nr:transcription termination factor Rho [Nocardia yunnanensis]AYF76144.1 transcription termination factor Rho [Nocardia yunnanensis]